MGPTRTVPPDHPATPRTQPQLVNDPLELDRPLVTAPEPTTPAEGRRYPAPPLDGTREQRDALDLVGAEPIPYLQVAHGITSRGDVVDEPLGRRTPEPLDAAREGVER